MGMMAEMEFMVMEMTDEERTWVQETLGSDAGAGFDELDEVDCWYAVDRGGHVEVIPVVGLEATEPDDRDGFVLPGSWDEIAPTLVRSGFPISDFS